MPWPGESSKIRHRSIAVHWPNVDEREHAWANCSLIVAAYGFGHHFPSWGAIAFQFSMDKEEQLGYEAGEAMCWLSKPPCVIASPLHFSGMAWRYHPISWPTKQNCTCCWASYWLWGNCKALLAYFALWELMLYFSTLSNPGWTIILHFKRQDHGSYSLRFHFLELTYIEIQARHWYSTSNLGTPVIDRFAIHDIQIPVGLPWLL